MGRIRRFAAIGDVHAEDESLAAVLGAIPDDLDAILCVGDVVDGWGDAERCCTLPREAGALVVRGNHERWLLRGDMRTLNDSTDLSELSAESIAWLGALPTTVELATLEGAGLLCHAVGDDDMTRLDEHDGGYALQVNDALARVIARGRRLMVCGHTHRPYVRRLGELLIVNAGTLYRDHQPGFVVVDLEQRVAERSGVVGRRIVPGPRTALP